MRGDRASVVIELSRGDRGNDTSVERWKLIIVEEKKVVAPVMLDELCI